MARLTLNNQPFDIDLIAFDKDGTLVKFDQMWFHIYDRWLEQLMALVNGTAALRAQLDQTLGLDTQAQQVRHDTPLGVATLTEIHIVAVTILYQAGISWLEAKTAVHQAQTMIKDQITADLVQPVGNVKNTLEKLAALGVRLAVITNDNQQPTLETLAHLDIAHLIDIIVTAENPFPNKPEPDGLLYIGRELGVAPEKMLMVGDTASDMLSGRRAGVAACVGIAGGSGDLRSLTEAADMVFDSIDQLLVR